VADKIYSVYHNRQTYSPVYFFNLHVMRNICREYVNRVVPRPFARLVFLCQQKCTSYMQDCHNIYLLYLFCYLVQFI